jgi:hypothetical protein
MPASRKLYEDIASEIADAAVAARYLDHPRARQIALDALGDVAYKISASLKRDNPRFDRGKFIEACQL